MNAEVFLVIISISSCSLCYKSWQRLNSTKVFHLEEHGIFGDGIE